MMKRMRVTSQIAAAIFGFAFAAQGALAATYDCKVTRADVKHPYFAERVVFTTDARFQKITMTKIDIKDVSTTVVPGELANRTRKRVRIRFPAHSFVMNGLLPKQPGQIKTLKPSEYLYELSISLTDQQYTMRVVDAIFGLSYGAGSGRCKVSN
ncbi:MAG: hypothetical protein EpisKO_32680 [Epibacterium sp.]